MLLESLRAAAERFRPDLFGFFHRPMARILEDSLLLEADRESEHRVLEFIRARYGARSLFFLPSAVAEEVLKRPGDFVLAAEKFSQPELL